MNSNETYILEDDRVLLRPLEESDHQHLLDYSLNEPDTWQYSIGGAAGAENLRAYIHAALQKKAQGDGYPFIVYCKKTGKYAGTTRFYNLRADKATVDLGFTWYGQVFRGTGLNKHCKYLLLEFAFNKLNMERVGFSANSKNERSIRAMKAIGCSVEGVMRSYGIDQAGNRSDSVVLSILRNEWETSLRDALKQQLARY